MSLNERIILSQYASGSIILIVLLGSLSLIVMVPTKCWPGHFWEVALSRLYCEEIVRKLLLYGSYLLLNKWNRSQTVVCTLLDYHEGGIREYIRISVQLVSLIVYQVQIWRRGALSIFIVIVDWRIEDQCLRLLHLDRFKVVIDLRSICILEVIESKSLSQIYLLLLLITLTELC